MVALSLAASWSCSRAGGAASPTDANAASDAASDAAHEGGGSACDRAHLFCDDFDRGTLGASWDQTNTSGGPLATDDAHYVSAPRALRAQSAASATPRSVVLYKNLPGPPGKLHCVFDVLVQKRLGGSADLFELRLDTDDAGASHYYVYLQVTETGTFVGQEILTPDGGSPQLVPVADLPNGQWRHVSFETDFTSFTFSYQGEPAHTETMRALGGTKPQMAIGLVFTEGGGPYDFLFDDVACDMTP